VSPTIELGNRWSDPHIIESERERLPRDLRERELSVTKVANQEQLAVSDTTLNAD